MHVGLALEFNQMKILAEGFAQACVHHDYWYTEFLHKAEADAKRALYPALSLSEAIDEARADPVIRGCSSVDYQRQFEGEGKDRKFVMRKEMIKDGVCGNASVELGSVAARYRVDPNDLERATAELINTAVHTAAASQYPRMNAAWTSSSCTAQTRASGTALSCASPLSPTHKKPVCSNTQAG